MFSLSKINSNLTSSNPFVFLQYTVFVYLKRDKVSFNQKKHAAKLASPSPLQNDPSKNNAWLLVQQKLLKQPLQICVLHLVVFIQAV
jgi:hypothetical protein